MSRLRLITIIAVCTALLVGFVTSTDIKTTAPTQPVGLDDPAKKAIAMQLVSSAENSTLDWQKQYSYIEDIGDGRGYTAGIIGFCSGTGDLLEVVRHYTKTNPGNRLAKYLPALKALSAAHSGEHTGLDGFEDDWKAAAQEAGLRQAQDWERDRVYFNPAVGRAKKDGLRALGQFMYYDAAVMHGVSGKDGLMDIRANALKHAKSPAQGGDEATYLRAFMVARKAAMEDEAEHRNPSRVDDLQKVFVDQGNFDLNPPLEWHTYGDKYRIK